MSSAEEAAAGPPREVYVPEAPFNGIQIANRVVGSSFIVLGAGTLVFLVLVIVPARGVGFLVSSISVFTNLTLAPLWFVFIGLMLISLHMRRMVGPTGFRPNRMNGRRLFRRGFRSVVPWEEVKMIAVLQVDQREQDEDPEPETPISSEEKVVWGIEVFAGAHESYLFHLHPYSDELDFSLALLQTFAARGGEVKLPDHSADEDEWDNRWAMYSQAPPVGEDIVGLLDRVRQQVDDYKREESDAKE